MVSQHIIEGYGIGHYYNSDVDSDRKYQNRVNNRERDGHSLQVYLALEKRKYNIKKPVSDQATSFNARQLPVIENERYRKQTENNKYTNQITVLKKDKANLEFDNRTHKTTINKHGYKISQTESEYDRQQTKSKDKSTIILPLKKRETLGAKKYYSLLMFQNEEIKTETYSQKNNLTTADRNYDVHNSKIPYYVLVNQLLLYTYIAIALYISYRVMRGMIVDNIYGKLIIILLISLYPIYMFSLEIAIYDQYSLIKSMIRAEPYKPIRI